MRIRRLNFLPKSIKFALLQSSDSEWEDSSSSSSESSPSENIFKSERLKKWATLAKNEEDVKNSQSIENQEKTKSKPIKEENKIEELPEEKTEEELQDKRPTLQKPKFMMNNSERSPKKANNSKECFDLKLSQERLLDFPMVVEEKSNGIPEEIKEESKLQTKESPTDDPDFKSRFQEAQRLSRLGLHLDVSGSPENKQDFLSAERENVLESRKTSEEPPTKPLSISESGDFLQEFFNEARENIREVIELLLMRENSLKNLLGAVKVDKEADVIGDSLKRMRDFEGFMQNIANKPFTNEITEELKRYLGDLKEIKETINEKYKKNVMRTPEKLKGHDQQFDFRRPSIENMTQFQQSLDNIKSKIRESMNTISKDTHVTKKRACDIEEIERRLEIEMHKMRSIHRKDSFKSDCESLHGMLDEAYQNIESLRNRDVLSKDVLTESFQKVENSQQNLKAFYTKLIEKQEQIVFEDVEKENGNLKVIKKTQDQLNLLRSYLKEAMDGEGCEKG